MSKDKKDPAIEDDLIIEINPQEDEVIENEKQNEHQDGKMKGESEEVETHNQQSGNRELIVEGDTISNIIHILPLSERPFFPPQVAPLILNEEPWLTTLDSIMDNRTRVIGLVLAKEEPGPSIKPEEFYEYGTLVRIHHPHREEGRVQFIAQGLQRFRIKKWISTEIPFVAQVEYFDEVVINPDEEIRAYSMAVINALKELMPLNPLFSEELKYFLARFNSNDPSPLADFAASLTTSSKEDMQEILATVPLIERMQKVVALIHKELEVAKLHNQIRAQVDSKISEQQREFFLREQLKVIQQELGIEKDDKVLDLERLTEQAAATQFSPQAEERFEEELEKLSMLDPGSTEYSITRGYLDLLVSLPWNFRRPSNYDLDHARRILDREHFGLKEVKARILEMIAIGKRRGKLAGTILLLVGPPGVGKTSIGRSVANSLDRPFFRFSVGGMRDEAEIKGHRRTYIGAMPGKMIQALKETGVDNPVIMLDEIDKMGQSYQGDPASALLEVLDPEQNSDFLDHYLDLRFDLSNVLFICTANTTDSIPAPLLDRMDVIRLSGYILEEKQQIARKYLWPKQLKKGGFKRSELQISNAALSAIIDKYARESGVRQLEKYLAKIVRKAAIKFADDPKLTKISIGVNDITHYLGNETYSRETPLKGVGVITGLAWTALGGATLSVEAIKIHTKNRGFKVTGQLGEVMQESANIAYSYVMANAKALGAQESFFENAYIHLHAPEGAVPKDGPSAGITIASALLSLALEKEPRNIAMTGELTLTGQVLPIGGVKEKLIAAKRVGISELIFPKENRRDFETLPDYLKEGITPHFVGHFDEVAALLF